ncbi:sensor histidine kinase [Limosilactobacillus ingluviei]|uniref:sensor histidine kinase n=1 Tax=Limosilactobacillus ingluviei TaxID=148604 RepID=UPI0002F9DC0E|nr:GHKL domain-containing protein [Limosilactobacillus ingluviei]
MIDLAIHQIIILDTVIWLFPYLIYRCLFFYSNRVSFIFDILSLCFIFYVTNWYSIVLGYATFLIYIALEDRIANNGSIRIHLIAASIILAFQLLVFSLAVFSLNSLGIFNSYPNYGGYFAIIVILIVIVITLCLVVKTKNKILDFLVTLSNSPLVEHAVFKLSLLALFGQLLIDGIAEYLQVEATYQLSLLMIFAWFDLLLMLATILLIQSYQRELRLQVQNSVYQKDVQAAKETQAYYLQLRKERHDLKNMLLSVQGYLKAQQLSQASHLIDEITHQQSDQITHSIEIDREVNKIGLPGLQNVLQNKAYQIIRQNSQALLSIEVNDQITTLPGAEMDLVRIIGILMDNVVEAIKNQPHPKIQIALLKHGQAYEFTVTNSITNPITVQKIFAAGYSTKPNHAGLGLANVQELVAKNDSLGFEMSTTDHQVQMSLFIRGSE